MSEFQQDIIKILLENGILAIALAIVGFWINRSIEKYKSSEAVLRELKKQNLALQNSLIQDKRDRKLKHVDSQLKEFFYPIFYRLQKDDALWRLSPQLSKQEGSLPMEANDVIEKKYILKNHQEVIEIIESKSNLIEEDADFQEQIKEYIKHVAIYETIRSVDSLKHLNPIDFQSPYPKQFKIMIESKMKDLRAEYEDLLNKYTSEHPKK
jgi:hypothetical protein